MWQTPQGVRVLRGAEARLFRTGVLLLHEQIADFLDNADPELNIPTGIPIFDSLEPEGKTIALAEIAKGLLRTKSPAEAIKPWHNAAVLAVYRTIKTNVQVEMGMERHTEIRKQIANAYLQTAEIVGEYDTVINLEQDTCADWHLRVDTLTTQVANIDLAEHAGGPNINNKAFVKAERFLQGLRRE
jgi:hypothetical protein